MWPDLDNWANNAHLCLILLLFNFASVCAEGNKQRIAPPCSHILWLKPPHAPLVFPSPPLWRPIWTLQRMQRYRSYIEAAFQFNPHRVDDRLLLKRKRHAEGDFKSEEDIRKIHWKWSPLAIFFFHFQEQFCTFPSEWKMCSVERGEEEWRDAVFLI